MAESDFDVGAIVALQLEVLDVSGIPRSADGLAVLSDRPDVLEVQATPLAPSPAPATLTVQPPAPTRRSEPQPPAAPALALFVMIRGSGQQDVAVVASALSDGVALSDPAFAPPPNVVSDVPPEVPQPAPAPAERAVTPVSPPPVASVAPPATSTPATTFATEPSRSAPPPIAPTPRPAEPTPQAATGSSTEPPPNRDAAVTSPPPAVVEPPSPHVVVAGPSDEDARALAFQYTARLLTGEFRDGELASFFSRTTTAHKASVGRGPRVVSRQGETITIDVDVALERTLGSGAVNRRVSTVRLLLRGRRGTAVIESASPGPLQNPRWHRLTALRRARDRFVLAPPPVAPQLPSLFIPSRHSQVLPCPRRAHATRSHRFAPSSRWSARLCWAR